VWVLIIVPSLTLSSMTTLSAGIPRVRSASRYAKLKYMVEPLRNDRWRTELIVLEFMNSRFTGDVSMNCRT